MKIEDKDNIFNEYKPNNIYNVDCYEAIKKIPDKSISDGSLYEALDIACDRYTDMTRKFFNAVYKHIATNEVIDVYKEYTKEEIEKLYNEDKFFQEHYTLEEILKKYMGKPKLSLKMFKTSQDIIDWYFNLQKIYRKMCKCDLKEVLENGRN